MIGEQAPSCSGAVDGDDANWLFLRLQGWSGRTALVSDEQAWSFDRLCGMARTCLENFRLNNIAPGDTLAIQGDHSPWASALLIAALVNRNIVVPIASAAAGRRDRLLQIAEVTASAVLRDDGTISFAKTGREISHDLLLRLGRAKKAGLVLFSSGSTGESKGAVLDFGALLSKFRAPRKGFTTLVFLLLDHIGGINSLFHALCHGGTIVAPSARTPDAVGAAIEANRVQLLPTTPTFLRMLMIAGAHKRFDLSSLEVITYGTEPMPAATLAAARNAFPDARLKQTYGLSELGILPTQSRGSDSLWLKLGASGFEHKIVDGILHIRAASAMLGYLNAASPFDADGWFDTNDMVEVDGDYLRILGRRSELINVGGDKVHPAEIEDVLLRVKNVRDAVVSARHSPVTGAVVAARITPCVPEVPDELRRRVRRFCQERLERYKVPAVIEIVEQDLHGARFKKSRVASVL